MGVAALAVLGALGATACGSDDGAASKGTPVEQCQALLEAYCSRAADCVVQLMCDGDVPRATEHDQCLASISGGLDCTKAVGVAAAYDTCLGKTKTIACSEFGTSAACVVALLPAECSKVIQVSQ